MPIDASIALQGRPVADPLESYGKALSLKSLMGQQQMQELQMRQAQQQEQEQQALNEAYRSSTQGGQVDRTGLLSTLAQRGLGSRIPAIQKQFADADKAGVDVTNTKSQISERDYKTAKMKLEAMHGALSSLLSNPNVTHDDVIRTIQQQVQSGVIDPQQGIQMVQALPGNPQQLRPFLLQKGLEVVDAGKRIELLTPKVEYKQTGKEMVPVDVNAFTNPTPQPLTMTTTPGEDQTAATARAGQAVTMRGQNMVDARSKESTAAALTKPFELTGPDGQPVVVQQDKQGNITPVPGYGPKAGASKPLNDSQAKALGFGTRMQKADELLNGLAAKGVTTPSVAQQTIGDTPFLGPVANAFSNPDQQSVEQAQRDFVNAILRRESGAAISSSEFDNAKRQYFPQRGDSAQVIAQKAANRKLATEGVIAEVPVGQRGSIGPKSNAPKPGTTQDGYVFTGGDPANPSSWKKQ